MRNVNDIYHIMSKSFTHFNTTLFNGELDENILLTIDYNKKQAMGFYSNARLDNEGEKVSVIGMNPMYFSRTLKDVMSTLVHEQAHAWQYQYGRPNKTPGHNKQWAAKMKEIGLQPYNVKDPEKEIGKYCSHTIIEGGAYDIAFKTLGVTEEELFTLPIMTESPKQSTQSRIKFVCRSCGNNFRAHPNTKVICTCLIPPEDDKEVVDMFNRLMMVSV